MQHTFSLVVLTLLQLCRAEIPKALPEWYAANLINDAGYQPKPISEIFTTPVSFSAQNPIIVLTTSSTTPKTEVFETSTTTTTQTTEADSSPSTEDTTRRVLPLEQSTSTSSRPQEIREQRQYMTQPQQIQVLMAQTPPAAPQIQQFPQIQSTQQQNMQPTTGQPNYFLIYQQAPLSIQQYPEFSLQPRPGPPSSTQTTTQELVTQRTTQEIIRPTTNQPSTTQSTTVTTEQITEAQSTTLSTMQTTSSTPRIEPKNRQIPVRFISAPILFGGAWQDPSTSPGAIYSNPPISSTIPPSSSSGPCPNGTITGRNLTPNITAFVTSTQNPIKIPGLTIRVTAPRGSITNIKINPTTTTEKPTTRRSQRRKGNNYNVCVNSCKGKRDPICAAPLAIIPIDPNRLKGFPSICHLACHNSFRKNQPYEKIMDGKCSKLRTRIRTFDKNKLKREELNKTQYTILSNNPETVVQIIPNERSG